MKTSGTPATTVLIKSFSVFGANNLANLRVLGNNVYFTARDGNGRELWKSDGTTAGTIRVKDIAPGTANSDPSEFAIASGLLYFAATGPTGRELWRSDGTAGGTIPIKDINPGSANSSPNHLVAVGSIIYFAATSGTQGEELWRTNGSAAGTFLVKDFIDGQGLLKPAPRPLAKLGNKVLLTAAGTSEGTTSRLWISGGTPASTVMISSFGA